MWDLKSRVIRLGNGVGKIKSVVGVRGVSGSRS